MTWFLFAILCAISEALKDITSKRSLASLSPMAITWVYFICTTSLIAPLVFWEGIPTLGPNYWWYLITHGTLFGTTVLLYMKAISLSSLSVSVPMVMFTPLFMLITAPVILGEWPNRLGLFGTVLIVVGSYLLNIRDLRSGLFAPVRALLQERGARIMLLVAVIWSVTSTIDKLGIQNSSPIFWAASLHLFITAVISAYMMLRRDSAAQNKAIFSHWRRFIPVGVFNSVQLVCYVFAMQSGPAVYVLSIKRTSVLMVLVLGAVLFGETRLRERFAAALVMLSGVICISLS